MAVQKSRVTRSRRGMRRSHDKLTGPTLSIDPKTGATHRRHHITQDGYYKGRQMVKPPATSDKAQQEE
ncbi:MAG: 50S ribosomal protein L32 [Gammaproteobacteria bacterium RIFCSPHIGHO2_12_FULL_42_10]|nr:MAG: 50S ribosomal protein L32 [Gammaproteobacteria bacterium RIFCSPHIGHO2_12_FULL_42_10]